MALDKPKKPDELAQPGASTPQHNGSEGRSPMRGKADPKGTESGTGVPVPSSKRAGARASTSGLPSNVPSTQAPMTSMTPMTTAGSSAPSARASSAPRSGAPSAPDAGAVSRGGTPVPGSAGRGTKSLGGPSGAAAFGAAPESTGRDGSGAVARAGSRGTAGARGQQPSPGSSNTNGPQGAPIGQNSGSIGGAARAGTSPAAEKTTQTADNAGKEGRSAGAANSAILGAAGGAAGGAARRAVEGDGSSVARRGAGRYAAAAASGAVTGALAGATAGGVGAVPGAAIGGARNVGLEAGKDAVEGACEVTGAGPDAEPADKRLGAGGTGYVRADKKDGELVSKAAKGAAVGGAAAAAPPAMGLIMLMSLLKWLKTMFFAAMAMAANAANLAWAFLIGVAKAAGHAIAAPFTAIGTIVGKAAGAVFGVAVTATVAPVATAASGVVASLTSVTVLSTVITGVLDRAGLDDRLDGSTSSCVVNASNGGPGAQIPANTEANARVVYSVLSSWGMPEENIAGILGNWSQESGIDPTSVEGIYDEPYRIGPRKQAVWDGGFTHIAGQSHGGIGLGQWSNGRTPMLLDYAEAKELDWYTIEAQLAFMVEGDNPSDVAVFKAMITTSQGSPTAAAVHFHDAWERSADNAAMMAERTADAEMWFAKMSGWSVDDSVVGSVEDIVGGIVEAIGGGINTILDNCDSDDEVVPGSLVEGGMNQDQAQQLIDLYNKEGDKFLDENYGNRGGPGSCGNNHAMNCVSFSTYFVNKYTSFQQYPSGDGIQTAGSIASMTGKQLQDNPVPYSVGSGPASGPAGHTLVVLGVDGDEVIVGEAGYCAYMGRVRTDSAARLRAAGWKFVDVSDLLSKGGSVPDALPVVNSA